MNGCFICSSRVTPSQLPIFPRERCDPLSLFGVLTCQGIELALELFHFFPGLRPSCAGTSSGTSLPLPLACSGLAADSGPSCSGKGLELGGCGEVGCGIEREEAPAEGPLFDDADQASSSGGRSEVNNNNEVGEVLYDLPGIASDKLVFF